MHKAQVLIRDDQHDNLKALSIRTGQRRNALIRQGVDLLLREEKLMTEQPWKKAWQQACGMWEQRDEVEQLIKQNRTQWTQRIDALIE